MWITITNWSLALDTHGQPMERLIARRLGCSGESIHQWKLKRRSIDARKKDDIRLVWSVEVEVDFNPERADRLCEQDPNVTLTQFPPRERLNPGAAPLDKRPVVIGFGPSGIFCALRLAEAGYRPVVFEQGRPVEDRQSDVLSFWQGGPLLDNSNVQFGEGGAGAFSDGKLTTRVKDTRVDEVLHWLVRAGGPPEILYEQKPHIGTDRLIPVVARLREKIIALGGTVRFGRRITRIASENGRVSAVLLENGQEIACNLVFLAIGNSGRDLFRVLPGEGFELAAKPFAMGLRIEHPQQWIDEAQYGAMAGHPALGRAEYQLTYRHPSTGRSVYSFCMCPGGQVIAATSEQGCVVTNGMSLHARDSGMANSALVVTVTPEDYDSPDPLAGVEFQRRWEKAAFRLGGGGFHAPVERVQDFLAGYTPREPEKITPTYLPGTKPVPLADCLPDYVSGALRAALQVFNRQVRRFADDDAVLTGVETRTSSPVRIVRNEQGEALGVGGVYPIGEGAGYAGGIVSAALDGWLGAGRAIAFYARPKGEPQEELFRE